LALVAVAVRDPANLAAEFSAAGVRAVDFEGLAAACDIVVEALPRALFRAVAEPAIDRGLIFMPLSVGALLDEPDLIERARASGARIIVPTGALLGLDAVRAAAEGTIVSAAIETRKPPAGLRGAPYLERHGISLDDLREPLLVFSGSARDGARGFPANVNVAAALSLAGIGADRTRLDIWADPGVTRNTHRITVEADSARFSMEIEGVPSDENPRTGKLTPLSTIAALRSLVAPLRVGT
jgi:aspartate dehydrogenase